LITKRGVRSAGKVDSVQSGESCNWRCYALAVARLEIAGRPGRPWHLGYWHVKETGFASETKQKRTKAGEPLPMGGRGLGSAGRTLEQSSHAWRQEFAGRRFRSTTPTKRALPAALTTPSAALRRYVHS